MASRVFVKGLPPNITEADLRKHFSAKGEITDIKLKKRRQIGFVGFKTSEQAALAAKHYNRTFLRMSKLSVELAKPILHNDESPPKHPTTEDSQDTDKHAGDTSRKRKRGIETEPLPKVSPESDPKLREFLSVMGPNNNVDNWQQQAEVDPEMPSIDDAEGDEEEYQELQPSPQKRRQTLKETKGPSDNASATRPAVNTEAPHSQPIEEDIARPNPPEELQEDGQNIGATDDEWLRSRTNRVLDLMDVDEVTKNGPQPTASTAVPDLETSEGEPPGPMQHSEEQDPIPSDANAEDLEVEKIIKTKRLFLRNLPYTTSEGELREGFEEYGELEQVHLCVDRSGKSKGYAFIQYVSAESAIDAFQKADRKTWQGRLLHVLPADHQRVLDEDAIAKLPLKKQNLIKKRREAGTKSFNWNSLYMNQDAVNQSMATRFGVSKSALLDPTSGDAAVKQAIAETTMIQETRAYFAANGVDLDALKYRERSNELTDSTAILVKNFSYGTTVGEIRERFEEFGSVLRVLMPPSGTIAIVQFSQPANAKAAYAGLKYRLLNNSIMFLEIAPKSLLRSSNMAQVAEDQPRGAQKLSATDLLERDDAQDQPGTSSLFVKNLNFTTTTEQLAEAFKPYEGFVSALVKTKADPKKPGQTLSMGFGFVEFRTKEQAHAASSAMNGATVDGHILSVRGSHKGNDAAEERRREDRAKKVAGQKTKIVVKNLPFEATKKDVRALFVQYGQLRAVRVPKKIGNSSRGFAFAEFVNAREAANAMEALKDTHLLGRRLALDYAEAEVIDPEEEIAKMQRKIGVQVNKVTLQQLAGRGRQKVNIDDNNDDEV